MNVPTRGLCGSSCVFVREKLYWVASRQVARASGRKPTFLLDATDGGMPVRQCPGCLRSWGDLAVELEGARRAVLELVVTRAAGQLALPGDSRLAIGPKLNIALGMACNWKRFERRPSGWQVRWASRSSTSNGRLESSACCEYLLTGCPARRIRKGWVSLTRIARW